MAIINIQEDIEGDNFLSLLRFADSLHSTAQFVVHPWCTLSEQGLQVIKSIEPFLLSARQQSAWPGTELHGGLATVYHFTLQADTIHILASAEQSLFGWQHPLLPEDLCLLRENKDPWLVSIAHESDAFLNLDDNEFSRLVAALPEFRGWTPAG